MGIGDNLIHETVYNDVKQNDGTYNFKKMYTNFKKDATNSDISFINQETVLGVKSLVYPVIQRLTLPLKLHKI